MRALAWITALFAVNATAQPEPLPREPHACFAAQIEVGGAPVACVSAVQSQCTDLDEGSPDALACYRDLKSRWGGHIAARIAEIQATAPEKVTETEGSVRQDVRAHLQKCERLGTLERIRREPDDVLQQMRAECESTAVGLAYMKLLHQSLQMQ